MTLPGRHLSWRPRRLTLAFLTAGVVFNLWLFTPQFWSEIGVDSKDLYAAATLAQRGGNPYDPAQQVREQDRLYNAPRHLQPTDPDYYHHATYAYPQLFTWLSQRVAGLGEGWYYGLSLVVFLGGAIVGLEALLRALAWRGRVVAYAFLLGTAPLGLALFVGNPSPVLLLGFGLAFLLLMRGRSLAAGAALGLCLVKLPVGLPLAACLLLLGPGDRLRTAAGFGTTALGLLALDLLLTGPTQLTQWMAGLGGYGSSLSTTGGRSLASQTGLAGLPGLLVDHLPLPLAVAISCIPVGALLVWAWRRRTNWPGWREEPVLGLALLTAAALAVSPYLHLNDLVLEALPLLVIASRPLTWLSRLTLTVWVLAVPGRLVALTVLAMTVGFKVDDSSSSAGIGAWLSGLTLVALVVAAGKQREA